MKIQKNKMSGFTKYKEGYLDGYAGRYINVRFANDIHYIAGYNEGLEDDRQGLSEKFCEDPDPVPLKPWPATDC